MIFVSLGESGHESARLFQNFLVISTTIVFFNNCWLLIASLFQFCVLGRRFFPSAYGLWSFRLMVLVILPHLPYFSRRLYREFWTEDLMTLTSFFRKKDLGFGLIGFWVSLALPSCGWPRPWWISCYLLLQVRRRVIFFQVVNLGGKFPV